MPKRSSVSPERNRNKRRKSLSNDESCTVFVGNLRFETRWQALKDHMRRAGNVDSVSFSLMELIGKAKQGDLVEAYLQL